MLRWSRRGKAGSRSRAEHWVRSNGHGRNHRQAPTRSIPLVKPRTAAWEEIEDDVRRFLATGVLTNGPFVRRFEEELSRFLEVEEAVAVSSCTLGLMMTLKVLGVKGEIIVPSFTFSATGHVCFWCGLRPAFVDCTPTDWNIDVSAAASALSPRTGAILAVHVFGNPADVGGLEKIAREGGVELIFDAAHALGSLYGRCKVGRGGHAQVFSLSPTKIATSGEGGVIATDDIHLARELRAFRNYGGDAGSADPRWVGTNARMPEFNAVLGSFSLRGAEREVTERNRLAGIYRDRLAELPGLSFQTVLPGNRSSYKDLTILVDEERFGMNRDALADFLGARGVETKKYFYPPLHMLRVYQDLFFRQTSLPITEYISRRTLTLPLHSGLGEEQVDFVCSAIREAHLSRQTHRSTPRLRRKEETREKVRS